MYALFVAGLVILVGAVVVVALFEPKTTRSTGGAGDKKHNTATPTTPLNRGKRQSKT